MIHQIPVNRDELNHLSGLPSQRDSRTIASCWRSAAVFLAKILHSGQDDVDYFIMDEIQVFTLIADGENARIEFKRELDLTVARSKAEFIKDVIALANTTQDVGYLLVGVDDSKMLVGTRPLEEEQIQQILSTYITPPVIATCETVSIPSIGFLSVVILEIRPTKKPHSVARTIEQLQQNRVFVRHGKVVAEASPDEIALMYEHSQAFTENRQYIRAAEKHAMLGNFEMAINAYSEAIKLTPTAELFLARGAMYERYRDQQDDRQTTKDMTYLAFKDYSDAAKLATSKETEKTARLGRWHVAFVHGSFVIADLDCEPEFEWLRANTCGRELGEVFFVRAKNSWEAMGFSFTPDAAQQLDEIIQLGYTEPDVYFLRADAHYLDSNYGLALADIDKAISLTTNSQKLLRYYILRASILANARRREWPPQKKFEDAYDSLQNAYNISQELIGYYRFGNDLLLEALYKIVLDHYLGHERNDEHEIRQEIARLLAYWFGHLYTTHPKIASTVRQIIGEDYWQRNKSRLE